MELNLQLIGSDSMTENVCRIQELGFTEAGRAGETVRFERLTRDRWDDRSMGGALAIAFHL